MTPTPTVLLLVALFWTLPATTAVLVYRMQEPPVNNVTKTLSSIAEGLMDPQPRSEA